MTTERPRVLVVDDDEDLRRLLEVILGGDFETVMAADGAEAIAMVDDGAVDAMVLDIMMPNVDGYEVLRHIRSHEHASDLPVVVLTARHGADWSSSSDRIGADAHLTKPYEASTLIATLHRLLGTTPSARWQARAERVAPLRPLGREPNTHPAHAEAH